MIKKYNVDLREYSTIKIGGIGSTMFFPENQEEFLDIYKKHIKDNVYILGKGSNTIFGDYKGIIVNTKYFSTIDIKEKNNTFYIKASAGIPLKEIIKLSVENNLEGIYRLSGFPASVGGATCMNAGAYGVEIFDFIKGVWYIEDGEIRYKKKEEIDYSYRHSEFDGKIVLYTEFVLKKSTENVRALVQEINQKRYANQPLNILTSGSTFKNPKDAYAGKLLEEVGLKGYRIKDIGFSDKHANFLINYQNASFEDVKHILEYAKEKVYKAFNIILEEEIKLICV